MSISGPCCTSFSPRKTKPKPKKTKQTRTSLKLVFQLQLHADVNGRLRSDEWLSSAAAITAKCYQYNNIWYSQCSLWGLLVNIPSWSLVGKSLFCFVLKLFGTRWWARSVKLPSVMTDDTSNKALKVFEGSRVVLRWESTFTFCLIFVVFLLTCVVYLFDPVKMIRRPPAVWLCSN